MPLGHSRQVDGMLLSPLAPPVTSVFAYVIYRAIEKPSHNLATFLGAAVRPPDTSAILALDRAGISAK